MDIFILSRNNNRFDFSPILKGKQTLEKSLLYYAYTNITKPLLVPNMALYTPLPLCKTKIGTVEISSLAGYNI